MRHILALCFSIVVFSVAAQVTLSESNLAILKINTAGKEIVDEPKINATLQIIDNGAAIINKVNDQPTGYDGHIGIEFRGSTSQWFPKKPYGFETTDSSGDGIDVSLLGMPKEEDWTLNATYNDKSLMRDGMAYILAGSIMAYAPRVRYCELVVNDQYQGVYLLIEKIKRGKNRVNIAKMDKDDIAGNDLTGGYILKIDKTSGSSNSGWNSPYRPYPNASQRTFFQIDYPRESNLAPQQFEYIKNYVTAVENSINATNYTDPINGYRKYIDINTLIDFIIVNELTKNPDAYRLSTYFYKERDDNGGMLKFGPVWDFNLGLGNVDYCTQGNPEGLVINEFNNVCPDDNWVIHYWWKKFMDDKEFYKSLKWRWAQLRKKELSDRVVFGKMDSLSNLLSQAQVRNFQQWPILGTYVWPNYYVGNTYQQEVDYLGNWMKNRMSWLDKEWGIPSATNEAAHSGISLKLVNPASDNVILDIEDFDSSIHELSLYDMMGRYIPIQADIVGTSQVTIDISGLKKGMYVLKVCEANIDRCSSAKLIKN